MSPTVLHRRRIERYAQLLDEASGARRHHSRSPIDDQLGDLVEVGQRLTAATPDVAIHADFRVDLRASLIARAERDGIGVTASPEPVVGRARVGTVHESASAARRLPKAKSLLAPGRGRTRAAILAGLAVGTLALSGISAASGGAMPGDAFYGIKRSEETTQLKLAGSNVSKGQLYLRFAHTRLTEAQAIRSNGHELDNVLGDLDHETKLGAKLLLTDALAHHDIAALATVDQFVTDQKAEVRDLLDGLAGASRDRVLGSFALLDQIGQRSAAIRAAVNCSSTASTGADALGPNPTGCVESTPFVPGPSGHPSSSGPTGTPSGTGTHGHGDRGATGTAPSATSTGGVTVSGPVVPAPAPAPSTDGGLLTDIGHLLGGLLGS